MGPGSEYKTDNPDKGAVKTSRNWFGST